MESTNLNISVKAEKTSACCVKFDVEVPAGLVAAALKKVTREYLDNVKLPGFRPGKMPMAVLERQYGPRIIEQCTYEILEKYLCEALESSEYGKSAIGSPELISNSKVEKDAAFTFSFSTEIAPTFEMPNYKGLHLTKKEVNISDEDVDKEVERFRQMSVTYEKTEDAGKENDMLIVDYKATVPEGVELPESTSYLLDAKGTWLPLRKPERLPGTMYLLIGKKAGDECDGEVAFPEDFSNESLRGKKLNYHFKVNEVRKETLPELNDEYVKRFGLKTFDELKDTIRMRLNYQAQQEVQEDLMKQISALLFDNLSFELPEKIVKQEVASRLANRIENEKRRGTEQKEISEHTAEWEKEIKETIEKALRREFLLQKIAEAEKVTFGYADYENYARTIMSQNPNASFEKVFKEKQKNGEFNTYLNNCIMGHAIDKIIEFSDLPKPQPAEPKADEAKPEAAKADETQA